MDDGGNNDFPIKPNPGAYLQLTIPIIVTMGYLNLILISRLF